MIFWTCWTRIEKTRKKRNGYYGKEAIDMLKILGLVATVFGVGATLLSDWVNEKKMEDMIDKKINERLENNEEKKES